MFANGTEYGYFIEKNCCNCKNYVTTEEHEATGKDYCQIENFLTLGCRYFDQDENEMFKCEPKIDYKNMKCKDFIDKDLDKKPIEGQIKMNYPEKPDS